MFVHWQSVDHQMAEQLLAFEKTSVAARKPIEISKLLLSANNRENKAQQANDGFLGILSIFCTLRNFSTFSTFSALSTLSNFKVPQQANDGSLGDGSLSDGCLGDWSNWHIKHIQHI